MAQLNILPYKNSLDHLFDELKLIELYLGWQVIKFRESLKKDKKSRSSEFPVEYITDEQVDSLFSDMVYSKHDDIVNNSSNAYENMQNTITQYKSMIEKRKQASLEKGVFLCLDYVCKKFSLSEFEKNVLLVCIAPQIDLKFEKLYVYLQNDVTKKNPTINFVLELLCDSMSSKLLARKSFLDNMSLVKYDLINIVQEEKNHSLLSSSLMPDTSIVNFLLEIEKFDSSMENYVDAIFPNNNTFTGTFPKLHEEARQKLTLLFNTNNLKYDKFFVYLHGHAGIGKKTLVRSLCNSLGLPLFVVDATKISSIRDDNFSERLITKISRNAKLHDALLYFDHFDALLEDNSNNAATGDKSNTHILNVILKHSSNNHDIILLSGSKPWPRTVIDDKMLSVDFVSLDNKMRKNIWEFMLQDVVVDSKMTDELAEKFNFTPNQISKAIRAAKDSMLFQNRNTLNKKDLYDGCLLQCNEQLGVFAKKNTKKFSFNDIILSKDKKNQLKEIISYIKHRNQVLNIWGFEKKYSIARGINILFAGESGTGKTMSASIIANELNLDMYKIDLSSVVSKYIGETEKNLNKIFYEAETSNSILFFDEADALFGKRSQIRDSHDRYANVEVNYLLQKLEEHNEIVILASNIAKNIDDAFTRRMHFWLDFDFPNHDDRLQLWRNAFPQDSPLSKYVDFEFLARQFKITGGNIKNIALSSAFYAADESSNIQMKHIILAVKRELQKIGTPITQSDFQNYYEYIND